MQGFLIHNFGGNGIFVFCSVCGSLGFEPLPETTRIEFNTALENGGNSQAAGFPGVDLLWTGNGQGNCWEHDVASATFPSPLPTCP